MDFETILKSLAAILSTKFAKEDIILCAIGILPMSAFCSLLNRALSFK